MKIYNEGVIKLSEEDVKYLLSSLRNVENKRYDYNQFSKLFESNIIWYGYIENGELKALAALDYNRVGCNEYYINEIQSFERGYGKKLLQVLLYHFSKIYFLVNPDANRSLLGYYKQFHLKEINIYSIIWDKEITVMYKGDNKLKETLIEYYK